MRQIFACSSCGSIRTLNGKNKRPDDWIEIVIYPRDGEETWKNRRFICEACKGAFLALPVMGELSPEEQEGEIEERI